MNRYSFFSISTTFEEKILNIEGAKANKTPAQAFTPPAETKMGTKWAFMYNSSGREHEKWLFKDVY